MQGKGGRGDKVNLIPQQGLRKRSTEGRRIKPYYVILGYIGPYCLKFTIFGHMRLYWTTFAIIADIQQY